MISFILTSRVQGNPDSAIDKLIQSLMMCGATADNTEILIKYDSDDELRFKPPFWEQLGIPFKIKYHEWSRGEGRHGLHLDHNYLFAQRNPKSRFVMICADDFQFIRPGFIDEILSFNDEYCFVGYSRPNIEQLAGKWHLPQYMQWWKHNGGVCLPCFTTKTAEVLQNFGWQCNADNWQTLLVILMYEQYGLDLWRNIAPYYSRNPTDGTSGYGATYNNMEMDGAKDPQNKYYFDLVKQQAKNLYLNIKYGAAHE